MLKYATLLAALCAPVAALAARDDDLREQVQQLERRVERAEAAAAQSRPPAAANAFNPAIALILAGTYGQLRQDPTIPATGFALSPNNNSYARGFGLGESELSMMANIDPLFRGVATMALNPNGGITVENGFVQATRLGSGFKLAFGRFFSGLGYLNEQHAHAWDFVDQPLVYRSLWDNQLRDDGVQLRWLAPTDTFIEIGGELGSGSGYPGSNPQKNGAGAEVLFAHAGGDVGVSNSWRAGISAHQTRQSNWVSTGVPDLRGTAGGVTESFTGDAHTTGLDFVWKYAPEGNPIVTNLKLQAEYFRRRQRGQLTYIPAANAAGTTDGYAVTQSGWYLQAVYQFMPMWRAGLRYDQLSPGTAQVGALNAANVIGSYGYLPSRTTLMLDFSPSEFSRIRLHLARDRSRQGLPYNQMFLQYVMSMGAHGAHSF